MTRNVKTIHGHQATGNCGPTEGVRKCTLLGVNASSRFGQYILRFAAVLILIVVGVGAMWGQDPIVMTTDINEKVLYLIQSFSNEAFYIRNDTRNDSKKNLNTSNIVTTNSEFYFLDADIIEGTQYYYIVHNGTGKYVHVASVASGQALIYDNAPTDDTKDLYRFKIVKNSTRDAYNIIVKNSEWSLSKKNANSMGDYIELNSADSEISCWNIIAKTNYSKPAAPFNLSSLNGAKHKYYIQNNKYTEYYLISGQPYVTTNTQTDDNKADMMWYFVKAPASENDPYMDYYYIIHAQTGQYLRYRLDNTPENSDQAVELSDYNSSENDRFLYIVVRGSVSGETSTTYCIAPYLSRVKRVDNTISLCYKKVSSDGGGNAYTYAGVFKERANNNFTHWNFISATLGCEAPEIGYADDGKIQVTCETDNVTIWYTSDNSDPTDESNESRQQYNETNKIEVTETMTVVKAYAVDANSVLDPSDVTTFNLTIDDPVITYDVATNKAMINCTTPGATILYTTSDGEPTLPYPSGGVLLPIGDKTIRAIAKKGGVSTTTPVTCTIPFQTTVGENKRPYIIQSKNCKFYNMIPNVSVDENTKYVSTLNVPCSTMAWHFEYAEEGYYYIADVNGWYMYCTSNNNKYIYLKSSKDDSDGFKFKIASHANGGYNIIPKGQTKAIYKNNFGDKDAGLKPVMYDGAIANDVARWDINPYTTTNLPIWETSPFDVSTDNDTYYYTITPLTINSSDGGPLILNNDGLIKSEAIPPSNYDSRKSVWVIKKVGAYHANDNPNGDNDELLDFYTFQNAYTGELLYYNGAGKELKKDESPGVLQMGMPEVTGANVTWSHFVIVQTRDNGYNIIPRVLVDNTKAISRDSSHEAFNCINRANGGNFTGTWYDNDGGSRWTFTKVDDDVKCMEPVFTEEANGDIIITTVTNAAKILYTVDNTEPTNSSHEYTTKENTSTQKVIKAIAIMGDDASTASNVVTLLNKPDITLTTSSYEYDGTAKTFEKSNIEKVFITINEVEISVAATTYDVDGFENNIKAATPTDANPPTVTLKDDVDGDVWYIWNASKTFTITPKPLTITADSDSKVYDGTALTNDGYTNTDLADGDVITSVTVTGSQMNAGTSDNVPSAAVIEKDDEDMTANYNITYVDGTLEVTAKAVTITAKDASIAYNGSALTENDFETTALEEGDEHEFVVAMTVGSTITNVGTQPNVIATVDGVAVTTGNEAAVGNYLVTTANGTLTINPKKVTITANDATKEYDSTPLTEAGFTATALEEGDTHVFTVTITAGSTITGVGDEPNVIATVDGTAVTTGTEMAIGNYLVTTADGTLTISKRGVTVSGITAEDKVYDGTTVATLVTTGATFAEGNIIGGEELELISGTGTFDTKNVGTDKTVTITDLTLGGANAGNYVFAASEQQTTATASITAKSITAVSGITAVDKEYDGTTTADFDSEHATLTGMVENDDLTVTATGAFVDENVGEGKTVNISGLALDGDDAGNYELAESGQQTTATASITPKCVSVSGITAEDKVYDGTTVATLVMTGATIAEGNIIAGEELTLGSATGAFDSKDAGTNKTVTITGLTFGGAHAGNYKFTSSGQLETITANITPAPLTITANDKSITYGEAPANNGVTFGEDDGNGGTIKSFVGGEDETVLGGTLAFSYNSQEDGQGTAYTTDVPIGTCFIIPGGLTSTNYVITFVPGTLTIDGKSIGNGSLATDFTISFDENNDVILMDGETQLNEGTDYTIDADATISASGRYSVRTIHGIGNYGGTASIRNAIISFTNDGNGGSEYSATFVAESANPDAEPDPEKGHELPDGVTAYIITGINGNAVNAVALSYIPEGVPVLLLSNAALSGFQVHDVSGQTLPSGNNLLKEVTEESQHFDVKTIYLLYKNEFAYNKAGDLAKGNVYLDPAPSSPSGARLVINWGAENGINTSLISPLASPLSEVWHSLDGRRLSGKPTKKGLYIRDSQKVVIK